jgi:hypothetical protein
MRRRIIRDALVCVLFSLLFRDARAGGLTVTPVQTQSTSPPGVLVATDWGPGSPGINNPLSFTQFNPKLGALTAIDITLTTTIRNDYELVFVATPNPTTIYVATTQTTDPSILADPAKRALLTDGPTVTLFGPEGVSQIFGPPATRQPVDLVQLTERSGTWSSLFPITNPNFIPPTITTQSFSRTLTAQDAPALFADFIGTGNVALPVTATASSSFYSDSGNGGGTVLTKANAIVSIQYDFAPPPVPEPSATILLGMGIGISGLAGAMLHHRRARPGKSDRA